MCKKVFYAIKQAAFPENFTCDVCGIETFGYSICEKCLKKLEFNDGNVCPVCGRQTVRPEICYECKSKPPLYKKAVSPLIYSSNATILIKKFKTGSGYLKEYFADLICKKLSALPACDCIVYVPLSPSAKRKRGYNQTRLLAKSLSVRTGLSVVYRALKKVKTDKPQKLLSRKERELNVKDSFKAVKEKEVFAKRVLLVDDVLTTGATCDEVTKTLLKAGAEAVYVATIASVPINLPFNTKY